MISELSYSIYTDYNKEAIMNSKECACIFCFRIMLPSEIIEYCDYGSGIGQTAICPHCRIDSIIPDSLIKYTQDDLDKWHIEGWGIKRFILQKKYAEERQKLD